MKDKKTTFPKMVTVTMDGDMLDRVKAAYDHYLAVSPFASEFTPTAFVRSLARVGLAQMEKDQAILKGGAK